MLLLIEIYQRPLSQVLVSADIAEKLVRTLASAMGLVLAVPATTLVAVLMLTGSGRASGRRPPSAPPGGPTATP